MAKFMYVAAVPKTWSHEQFMELVNGMKKIPFINYENWLIVSDPTADELQFWWLPMGSEDEGTT